MIITLSRFRGLPSNAWVEELISNLEWRFNLKGKNENIVSFEQNLNLKGLDKLGGILDATSNHQVLKLLYHNYKNGGRDISFILHPYYVKQFNNRWFLFGLNNEYNTISTIALDRIVEMEIVDNIPFIINEHVDFEHYFDDVVGVTIPKDDIAKEQIVLKFSKGRFPYITSKPIHNTQKTVSEDECIVSIEVRPNRELDAQILSYGSDVEVLESAAYREHISKIIEENFKKYFAVQDSCTKGV
jgi:predicted DNA-binding transcriptional regulator YafY